MSSTGPVTVLLVPGSVRENSSNVVGLRTAAAVAPDGLATELLTPGAGVAGLPVFNPDLDTDTPPGPVAALRARLAAADAVLFCVPEYAGTLPGAFKNLLDWTVGGAEMDRKPVAWLNVAPEGRGRGATETLAVVLGYLGTVPVTAACVQLPLASGAAGPDGTATDPGFRAGVSAVLAALRDHVRQRPGAADG